MLNFSGGKPDFRFGFPAFLLSGEFGFINQVSCNIRRYPAFKGMNPLQKVGNAGNNLHL